MTKTMARPRPGHFPGWIRFCEDPSRRESFEWTTLEANSSISKDRHPMKRIDPLLRNAFGRVVIVSMALTFSTVVSAAESYPAKPIRMIIPTSPGGTQDLLARLVAPKLSERLGKPVIVDNRSGAGQIIGTAVVANAAPDGYTLLLAAGVHATQPVIQKVPYDPIKSFSPIALTATVPFVLVITPSVPANTVTELIALAKQKPGKLIFAATGVGVTPHMSMELFRIMADIDIMIVHFKGQGPTITDLLGIAMLRSIRFRGFFLISNPAS